MKILGISAYYHDSAAALISDGDIIAAAQEERFTRIKHDYSFPSHAVDYCLSEAKISLAEIDYVVFFEKPFIKFERLLESFLEGVPRGFSLFFQAIPVWVREKLFQKRMLKKELEKFSKDFDFKNKILFSEHHLSHAASAYYPSPFKEAVVLTMDGVGEWATTSVALCKGSEIEIVKEIHFPHSLGLLYSAFTYYTGFKVNSGEYKLMGLAPYGRPIYADLIKQELIEIRSDGTFKLNLKYFDYCTGVRMTNSHFDKLFGEPVRNPESKLTQKHMDIAASIQQVTEEIILKLCSSLKEETGLNNLCLAGGVALNCVANGKIIKKGIFKNVWIQPSAGDAGGALGAALYVDNLLNGDRRSLNGSFDHMKGSYLGPSFSQSEVEKRLNAVQAVYSVLSDNELMEETASHLANDLTVGWFQSRMEFGPRALGNRSILGNPCSVKMQKDLNLKIKFRESFRPFAPSVLQEDVSEWFDLNEPSPYMLLVADVRKDKLKEMSSSYINAEGIEKLNYARSFIPAVTHVDNSARIQTVDSKTNLRYYTLINAFKKRTGCGVLVNTSFNIRGEPIVCTPEDAFRCFMGTNLDVLVVQNCMMMKSRQPLHLKHDYKESFSLD